MSSLMRQFYLMIKPKTELESILYNEIINLAEKPLNTKAFDVICREVQRLVNYPMQILEAFETIVRSNLTWKSCLKYLEIVHYLIHEFQYVFSDIHSNNRLKELAKFAARTNEYSEVVECSVVSFYYSYLNRLAVNYRELQICFPYNKVYLYFNKKKGDQNKNKKELLIRMFKVNNLLKYIIKIEEFFNAALLDFEKVKINRSVARLILNDCICYYNYLSKNVKHFRLFCFQLPSDEAIQFYEVYCEVIKLSTKMKKFYKLKNLMKNPELLGEPHWFTVEKDENKGIEIYMNDILARQEDSFKYDFKKSHTMFEPFFQKRSDNKNFSVKLSEPLRHSADANSIKILSNKLASAKRPHTKEEFLNDSHLINNWLNVSATTNNFNDNSTIFNLNGNKGILDDSTIKFFKAPDESFAE